MISSNLGRRLSNKHYFLMLLFLIEIILVQQGYTTRFFHYKRTEKKMLQINQWPSYKGVRPYIPLRSIKDIRTNLPFFRFPPPPSSPVPKQLEPYLKPFRSRLFIVVAAALINYKSYLNHFIILADYKRCWIILKMIFRMFMIWISRFFCFSLLLNWQIKNWYNKKKCSIERKDRMTLWYLLFTVGFFNTFTRKKGDLHRLDFPV